jgi:hypothetical protein
VTFKKVRTIKQFSTLYFFFTGKNAETNDEAFKTITKEIKGKEN